MDARCWGSSRIAAVYGLVVVLVVALGGDAPAVAPVMALWAVSDSPVPQREGGAAAGGAVPLSSDFASSTVGILVVDGGTHQCSASIVVSESRRLLATAAHCVWLDGRWTLDGAYFVPGYRGGSDEPWGRWDVETAWVPTAWQQARSSIEDVASDHDVAFARLAPLDGQLPEDALGGQGVWFDAPPELDVSALGYPGRGSYDGRSLQSCTDEATTQTMGDDSGEVLVMTCDMTEGSSGGPWLTGPDAATGEGQLVGVVSGGSGPELISTRFGDEAEQLYRAADAGETDDRG